MGGTSAQGGGTNSLPPGTPYGGGTVTGQTTFTGPPGQNAIQPPNQAFPTPPPGSAPGAAGGLGTQHPYGDMWVGAGAVLGSLLAQALQGGAMPGGMMPMGAPSPFGPSGFTPGLRGTGSGGPGAQVQGNAPSSGMGGPR
jgi:hypothetical protein